MAMKQWGSKLKVFSQQCLRVLKITRKPDRMEFMTIVKVSGIGMLAIGFIGFTITMIRVLFFA